LDRGCEVSSMGEVSRQQVQDLMEKGAQVVDVLPAEEFQEDHLPGAINLPLRKLETQARRALDPSRPIIVYCWDSA
jgi:rhodanese-related sulfurtransferase